MSSLWLSLATKEPDRNTARVQLLCADLQQAKTFFFDLGSGAWEFEQIGKCAGACQLARYTTEGEPFRIRQLDAPEWMDKQCNCALAGHTWAQLINVLNHILAHRKEPLLEQIAEREISPPYPKNTKLRREKVANSEAKKKSRANIVTISLSAPVRVASRPKASSGEPTQGIEIAEKMSVEGYWKVLIPGEGKPWKRLQIIQVDSYERRQKIAEARDRYRVEE